MSLTITDLGGQWSRRTRRPLVPKLQLGDPLVQQHAVSWQRFPSWSLGTRV